MGIGAAAAHIADEQVAPLADTVDRDGTWPELQLRALCERLGGLVVPVDRGGLGGGLEQLVEVCHIVAERCASTAVCFGMHHVATAVVAAKATDAQVDQHLGAVVAGNHICGLALSEAGSGAQFWLPDTRMERDSAGLVVTGAKTFVTSGGHADSYVVSVRSADGTADPGAFSCVVVPGDAPGMTWGEPWDGIGMRGNSSVALDLDEVRLADGALLGDEGDQIWFVFEVVAPYFLSAMAGTYLGIARAALLEARTHLVDRWVAASASSLADDPVLQVQFGELWAAYEAARALVYDAAVTFDRGDDALIALMSAKAAVAGTVNQVVGGCMTLVGGAGYRTSGVFERLLRNARAADVMSPTTNLLWQWIGRSLLDRNLLAP